MRAEGTKLEIRYVEWVDSAGSAAGWMKLSDVRKEGGICAIQTVGFVVKENDDVVLLLQSLDDQEDDNQKADNYIAIPKLVIKKQITLQAVVPDLFVQQSNFEYIQVSG